MKKKHLESFWESWLRVFYIKHNAIMYYWTTPGAYITHNATQPLSDITTLSPDMQPPLEQHL